MQIYALEIKTRTDDKEDFEGTRQLDEMHVTQMVLKLSINDGSCEDVYINTLCEVHDESSKLGSR
jgi:hypothetical protein